MFFLKKHKRYKIAASPDEIKWQPNNMCVVAVDDKKITLIKTAKKLYACAHECPHAGGVFAEGFTDGANNIICPVHDYKFSLETGENVSGEGYHLKRYKVEVNNEGVFVDVSK